MKEQDVRINPELMAASQGVEKGRHVEHRESITSVIVDEALLVIAREHADKAYHNLDHTLSVMRRSSAFLDIVRSVDVEAVPDRMYELLRIAAAYHDIVQDYEEVDGRRVRHAPDNEHASAQIAAERMRSAILSDGSSAYSEEEIAMVVDAILHTIPAWDPEQSTVYQPALSPESSLIARALAFADVNTAGIDGAWGALHDADTLFAEDNMALVRGFREDTLGHEEALKAKSSLYAWTKMQLDFVAGRRARLESEMHGLPERVQELLKDRYFVHFDEAVGALKMLVEEREQMDTSELIGALLR